MYAIINIAGQQFKVQKDQQIFVHRLPNNEGDKVTFGDVLFVDNDGQCDVGAPSVSGASVTAKVIGHVKGDKVIVFKKKRRKGYQTRNGHRQSLTQLAIDGISLKGEKKAAANTEAKPVTNQEKFAPVTESKVQTKVASPKSAPKADMPETVIPEKENTKVKTPITKAPESEPAHIDAAKTTVSEEAGLNTDVSNSDKPKITKSKPKTKGATLSKEETKENGGDSEK